MSHPHAPVIITAAICGAEVFRAQTPFIPYTPAELAAEAIRCYHAGARMVHLHMREDDGTPSQDASRFLDTMQRIRAEVPMVVQFSTGGAVGMPVAVRADALRHRPDMATLTTGTVNFGEEIFVNSLPMIREIAARQREFGVRPEIEVFDSGMIDTAVRLGREGTIELPAHFDFVMGVPGGMGASPERLDFLISLLPPGATWSVAGVGRHELPLAQAAMARGGHVRVGLEDNLFLSKGVLAKGSYELVEAVRAMAETTGRPIATADQTRALLRLAPIAAL